MKAAIIGGNFIGKGAEAMMTVVVTELQKRLPDISFVLMQPQAILPERAMAFSERFRVTYVPLGPRTPWDYVCSPVSKLLGVSIRHTAQFRRCIRGCVALLDIRGFTFRPDGGLRGPHGIGYYMQATIARAHGVKHIILPQVMGPIKGFFRRRIAARSVIMAESITVRDDTTKAVLDGIGVAGRKQVDVCPDIAFLFEASPEYVAREILAKTGIGQSPFVVVAPNIRIYERSDSVDGQNRYVAEHVKLIKHIRETLGLKVLLVPHEIWPSGRDDRHVISDICSRCDSRCGVYCLTEDHSAADLKAVIGCSEAVIGSRYHSLIASLSMGIPSMAISWSHKYEELMQSTGMVEYCVCGATLSGKQLCNKLSHLLADADHVRDYLRQTAEGFRTKIHRLFDETAAIIERASAT